MEEENYDRKVLRNKMVSFMYLIFIVLAFIYIPADFIDTVKDIDNSLSLSSREITTATDYNALLLDAGVSADSLNKLNLNGSAYYRVSKLSDSVYKELEAIQIQIMTVSGGINEYGYLKNAKDNQFTDKIMLEDGNASRMRKMLDDYKIKINKTIPWVTQKTLDSIISTPEIIKTSAGKDVKWEKFYFYKMPLSVSIAIISKFQNDLKAIESMIMDDFLAKIKKEYNLKLQAKDFKEEKPTQEKLETVTADAYVRGDDYNTLYKDVDNVLNLFHPFVTPENMVVNASRGQVIKKNNVFYLRLRDEGIVDINVYAAGSKNLIIKQRFNVKTFPYPFLYLAGRKGGDISGKILKAQKNIEIKNDFINKPLDYSIKEFSIFKIRKGIEASSKVINKGGFFTSETIDLIKSCEKGDLYIIDNVEIETPYGTTITLPTSIFKVK